MRNTELEETVIDVKLSSRLNGYSPKICRRHNPDCKNNLEQKKIQWKYADFFYWILRRQKPCQQVSWKNLFWKANQLISFSFLRAQTSTFDLTIQKNAHYSNSSLRRLDGT